MIACALDFGRRVISMSWLTGPIFDKELRVSSRRRRNYVLRFAYLALLTVFLALFWLEAVPRGGGSMNQVSRMAVAGKGITSFVIWFQFIAAQIIALIMLSTSISDEVYHRTLGLLMTTPINSFQIVIGKLFSKLLQIILILGISLPLLAIVRVFGGVPWDYVVSSLCVTLTAVIFVGSLSLFFSVFTRKAYVVMIVTMLMLFVIFGLLPWLSGFLYHFFTDRWPEPRLTAAIFFPNPYGVMIYNTATMISPMGGGVGGLAARFWNLHCGIMLAASGVVLFFSVCIVRKVALRQATGQSGETYSKKARRLSSSLRGFAPPRRVVGPAVMWKELRTPVLGRRKIRMAIAIAVGLILLGITYALCIFERVLDEAGVQVMYVVIFTGIAMLNTAILPATCITSEKESQAWPLLLTTTLSDRQILFGKFAGVVRRCMPAWCLLFGHLIVFSMVGYIHPLAIVHCGMLAAWVVAFLSGTGIYFSARFRHTTTAVIANFALAGSIWALTPILIGLTVGITRGDMDWVWTYLDTNPFVQAAVVAAGVTDSSGYYYWPGLDSANAAESTGWMLKCMVGYMFVGWLFMWRAKRRWRRNVF
ncbi:MAG: ABC transporter permease subunit [Sedimentisphaerales bacterium]|nr:ABC transporter permease subunit [Sedimentisphaerales bacterium]